MHIYGKDASKTNRKDAASSNIVHSLYRITGIYRERKHLRFENIKLINEKIFANDKSFNLSSYENKDLLENICEWSEKCENHKCFLSRKFPVIQ